MPLEETKQTEKTATPVNGLSPNGAMYLLSDPERSVMQTLHMRVISAKAKSWDAHVELTAAQAEFNGALGELANTHGLGGCELTPDFAAILRRT